MTNHVKMLVAFVLATVLMSQAQAPVTLRWEMGQNEAQKGYYSSRFIIKNVSRATLGSDWRLFFNQFSRQVKLPDNAPVDIQEVKTTYYQITPTAQYRALAPGDSMVVDLLMRGTMVNYCYRPQGAHMVLGADMAHPLAVEMTYNLLDQPGQWRDGVPYPDGNYMYAYNEAINNVGDAYTGNDYDIFPAPKYVTIHDGYTRLGNLVTVKAGKWWKFWDRSLNDVKQHLITQLKQRGIYTASGQNVVIELHMDKNLHTNREFYTLDVDSGRIVIHAGTTQGAHNGVTTLLAAIDHSKDHNLQNASVVDYPDLPYRGFMLDIARNFTGLDDLKRFVDLLAYYKINTFQFHFTDDEAWRLEIPGLPELTEVASRRGCTLDERHFLAQIFDGNGNPNDLSQSANGYLTRAQFVELLKYARMRGVKIIPEIETPGHARAAIVAMRVRHDRLKNSSTFLAEQYKLWDDHNTSSYTSAQSYRDNVLNVASDGVYNFIGKVVDELARMYKDAGLTLDVVHLGGDEVATQAWSQSPDVQQLMRREGLADAHAVSEYYITRVSDLLYQRGIRIEGWQEVAMNHSAQKDVELSSRMAGVNAWSTVGSRDVVPYTLANAGYPVILSNVGNFYMDMGYSWHPYEQGLHWGGKVDEFDSWSALPFNIYSSLRTTMDGQPVDLVKASQNKPALTKPYNIIGLQAQLWAETLRNFNQVQYLMLPKVFGVAERAWNARPEWAEKQNQYSTAAYDSARHQYNLKIGTRELPLLKRQGYNFRIGQPGIKVEGGMLMMNTQYPGVAIHYTLDGSEPSINSPLWTGTMKLPAGVKIVKARAYYLEKESVTTQLRLQ